MKSQNHKNYQIFKKNHQLQLVFLNDVSCINEIIHIESDDDRLNEYDGLKYCTYLMTLVI